MTGAENSASFCHEQGCRDLLEGWEDFRPKGKASDLRQAAAARPTKKDRLPLATVAGRGRRMIQGCFMPISLTGRTA